METVRSVAPGRREKLKYFITQGVSRGGDWVIQNLIIWSGGYFLVGITAGAIFNCGVGYVSQKGWVFKQTPIITNPKIQKPFRTFLIVRGGYALPTLLVLWILYSIVGAGYHFITSAVVSVTMWVVSYKAQRELFVGTVRKLPRPLRLARALILKPTKTIRTFCEWVQKQSVVTFKRVCMH